MLDLSVSGLDRELYSFEDFRRFAGSLAKVKMAKDFEGPKALNGRIVSAEGGSIEFDDRANGRITFGFENVAKANLKIDLKEEFSRG